MPESNFERAKTIPLRDAYAFPETYLEITVKNPKIQTPSASQKHVDYEIICITNIPLFGFTSTRTRRRYSDFVQLKDDLLRDSQGRRLELPKLPPKYYFNNQNFSPVLLEERMKGLESFLRAVLTHPLLQSGPSLSLLQSFLQDTNFES